MKNTLLILCGFVVILSSCAHKKAKDFPKKSDKVKGMPIEYHVSDGRQFADSLVYAKIKPWLDGIKKNYDTVVYFCTVDTNYLFYVVKGTWISPYADTLGKRSFKIGVVDKTGRVIIPVEYDRVYNPNGTIPGCIEVEKDKKRGLYSIDGKEIAKASYDIIYPSPDGKALAQVKLNNKFGIIQQTGGEIFNPTGYDNPDAFKSPIVNKSALKWKFDVSSSPITFLQTLWFGLNDEGVLTGRGVIFTPSYLNELGFLPPYFEGIVMNKEDEFGLAESKAEITGVNDWWDGLKTAFTQYYEVGLDGRGYESTRNGIVILDSAGNKVSGIEYFKPQYTGIGNCNTENLLKFNFIDSGLMEVRLYRNPDEWNDMPPDSTYDFYPGYQYYQLTAAGKLEPLTTPRRFSFTKYVKIDNTYFEGCFGKFDWKDDRDENIYISSHLTVEDLEVMKNEIYAEYGLIFKTQRWKDYFSKKEWYKPQFGNVDNQLSEIDRYNLKLITSAIEKVKKNPDGYVKKRLAIQQMAG